MNYPQVSVICLCYNHRAFIREAIESVLTQTYANLQIIIVDDASTDGSQALIQDFSKHFPYLQTELLSENVGNCKAFNRGLSMATGDFVIDFSTDDLMMPDRIQKQIDFFRNQNEKVGVVFTDAIYINSKGVSLRNHYDYLFSKGIIDHIPTGDVYRDVLNTYFICSPTMMIRKKVMDVLRGYDEALAYEDFDFWVRASRDFQFAFLDEKTTSVRLLPGSLSTGQYHQGDLQLHSTYLVCLKAERLCRDEGDRNALRWRVRYEFKHAVFSGNRTESGLFAEMLKRLGKTPLSFFLLQIASFVPLPWAWMRSVYLHLRYD